MDKPVYLETKDLVVGYDNVPLLTGVNIQLHAGEIMTLIGPNGAGKSTILKSIVGYLESLGGAVYISFQEDGDDFKKLFDFYPDEVSFCQSEFIGLTEYEGREVFVKKDTRYLRS